MKTSTNSRFLVKLIYRKLKSKYDDLVESTGYDEGTLRVFANVSRRFNNQFRENVLSRDNTFNISFHHFRAVAPLEDSYAAYWLQKAAENKWGVAILKCVKLNLVLEPLSLSLEPDEFDLTRVKSVQTDFCTSSYIICLISGENTLAIHERFFRL